MEYKNGFMEWWKEGKYDCTLDIALNIWIDAFDRARYQIVGDVLDAIDELIEKEMKSNVKYIGEEKFIDRTTSDILEKLKNILSDLEQFNIN